MLPYNNSIIPYAKKLRKNMTKEEKHLWYDFLNSYPINFQRQKTIGNYIADFYCAKAKLVIEIDGSQHYSKEGLQYDLIRTEELERYNLTVIRFTNFHIKCNFEGVCQYIDKIVQEKLLSINTPFDSKTTGETFSDS